MIDTRTVSPGTRPWLVENSTLIFAIAEYVIVAPVPIKVVVGALKDTALKNTMVSPETGVPVAVTAVIVPATSTSETVIVMSFAGDAPPRDTPGMMNS